MINFVTIILLFFQLPSEDPIGRNFDMINKFFLTEDCKLLDLSMLHPEYALALTQHDSNAAAGGLLTAQDIFKDQQEGSQKASPSGSTAGGKAGGDEQAQQQQQQQQHVQGVQEQQAGSNTASNSKQSSSDRKSSCSFEMVSTTDCDPAARSPEGAAAGGAKENGVQEPGHDAKAAGGGGGRPFLCESFRGQSYEELESEFPVTTANSTPDDLLDRIKAVDRPKSVERGLDRPKSLEPPREHKLALCSNASDPCILSSVDTEQQHQEHLAKMAASSSSSLARLPPSSSAGGGGGGGMESEITSLDSGLPNPSLDSTRSLVSEFNRFFGVFLVAVLSLWIVQCTYRPIVISVCFCSEIFYCLTHKHIFGNYNSQCFNLFFKYPIWCNCFLNI